MTKRNKRRFEAQFMLVLLAQLAYNLIAWTRTLLVGVDKRLAHFGCLRIVRDLFHIPGPLQLDAQGRVLQITFRASQPFAWTFAQALASHDLSLILDQNEVLRMNRAHLAESYRNGFLQLHKQNLYYISTVSVQTWKAALSSEFPDRSFEIQGTPDEVGRSAENGDFIITFWQKTKP